MMDRRRFLALGLATAAGIPTSVTAGCASRPAPAAEPATRTVRLGDTVADGNPEVAAERYFGAQLAQLTGDRYTVQIFPSGTLGDHNRMNEQVRSGLLPMTKTLFSNLTAFDKRLGVLSVPYAFTRQADLFTALDGRLGDEISAILRQYGLVLLGFFDAGSRNVYNRRRPIRTPTDLKGLKIRVPQDAVAIDTFNTLGAQATPLATNEIYSALQQGTIDGAENNVIFYVTNKHVDAARYWSGTRHQFGVDALLVSRKFFDALPGRDRDAFAEAGRLTVVRERQLWKDETDTYLEQARSRGAQVNDDVDAVAFQRAVKPVLERNRSTFGDLVELLPVS